MSGKNGRTNAQVAENQEEKVIQKYSRYRKAIVIGTSHSPMLGKVMEHLNKYSQKYAPEETVFFEQMRAGKDFKNAEFLAHVGGSVRQAEVFIFAQPRYSEGFLHRDLWEIMQLARSARSGFASEVHLIIPSIPYARQDRITVDREFPSFRLLIDQFVEAGCTSITTFEIHNNATVGYLKWGMQDLPMINFMGKIVKDNIIDTYGYKSDDISFVTPDFGGAKALEKLSSFMYQKYGLDVNVVLIQKDHNPKTGEKTIKGIIGEPKRICIQVDDMIDSAGTAANAGIFLRENYDVIEDIFMVAAHPIFGRGVEENLKKAGFKQVFTSDSCFSSEISPVIENHTAVSMAKMVAGVMDNIHNMNSVTNFINKF
jgi:ribose-phosphate pyrophosphokinase